MAPKFKKRAYKKRIAKRPARKGRGGVAKPVSLPGTLAPQHMLTKLRYIVTTTKSAAIASGITCFNQYRLNSIWDPDYSNTLGTSALGLAQWRALYQRYRVFKCDYSITLTNISDDTIVSGAIVPTNYNDSTFSISDYMRPLARRFQLGNRTGSNRAVLKGTIYLPKLLGLTPAQYKADATCVAGFGANPLASALLSVLIQSGNTGIAATVGMQLELTYHVEMMSTEASPEAIDHSTGLPVVPSANFAVAAPGPVA